MFHIWAKGVFEYIYGLNLPAHPLNLARAFACLLSESHEHEVRGTCSNLRTSL